MIYKHINPDNGRIFVSVSPGPSGCYVGYWIVGFWDVGDLCGEWGKKQQKKKKQIEKYKNHSTEIP